MDAELYCWWWMWVLLCIDAALQRRHSAAWNSRKKKHGLQWQVVCNKNVHMSPSRISPCLFFLFSCPLFLSFSCSSALFLIPNWGCDIITVLPALIVMWKWRRGKWVAGTSCWCLSGCTVVTMVTLLVWCVAMVTVLLWCPTAAVSPAGKDKVKLCAVNPLIDDEGE